MDFTDCGRLDPVDPNLGPSGRCHKDTAMNTRAQMAMAASIDNIFINVLFFILLSSLLSATVSI